MRQRGSSTATMTGKPVKGLYKDKSAKSQSRPRFFAAFAVSVSLLILVVFLGNTMVNNDANEMKGFVMKTPPRKFQKVPEQNRKTFFTDGKKISQPITRALRSRGWTKVNSFEDAQFIATYGSRRDYYSEMKPWQRYTHIPGYENWNDKERIVDGFKAYEEKVGRQMYFLPQTYRLNVPEDMAAFEDKLKNGGSNYPWVLKKPTVNQGKGIEMIAPNSKELSNVPARVKEEEGEERYIIQQYVCNELTWNRRKFDVRMFWFVASLDPLVVLYHDGYVRIGNSEYDETSFDNTVSHLTTHTGLGEEGKATFQDLGNRVREHKRSSRELRKIQDPLQHLKNQFKESLGELVAGFKDLSFDVSKLSAENGMGFYGADYVIDESLDVWLIEPQKGCGLDEDYNFRIEMHDQMFTGIVDVTEEIWQKQEEGKPILPLENLGKWEVVYADGWHYTYEGYERSKNRKGCNGSNGGQAKTKKKLRKRP